MLLVRGLAAIAFGLVAWFMPQISLAVLLLLFGAYALADGLLAIWTAVAGQKKRDHWWLLFFWGLVGVGIGALTLLAPGVTALALLFYIAFWAVVTGILQILTAISLQGEAQGGGWLIVGGLVSVVFGGLLIAQPVMGALALLWLIAAYAVLFGILLVIFAFKAKNYGRYKV